MDYPAPVVDHDVVSKRNIERMAAAYKRVPAPDTAIDALE